MIKSMTAYGRANIDHDMGYFVVEIQSVNRKHLDMRLALPGELLRFDLDIRKCVKEKVSRGFVDIKVAAKFESFTPVRIEPNLKYVKEIKNAWDEIGKELGVSSEFDLNLLVRDNKIFSYTEAITDGDALRDVLCECVKKALEAFLSVKAKEGKVLEQDIRTHLALLEEKLSKIEPYTQSVLEKNRAKLKARLEEILPGCVENEDKLLREIALVADRVDISEEIVRFKAHVSCFYDILQEDQPTVGKKMDFLIQELGREANTIASKSSSADISHLIVEIKSGLEKIREQVQNIE
jgi:uncharacterized protein (TIGR00255 family)